MDTSSNSVNGSLILFQCIEMQTPSTPIVHTHAWLFPHFSQPQAVEIFALGHELASQSATPSFENHAVVHTSMNSYMNNTQIKDVWSAVAPFQSVAVMTNGKFLPIDPYFPTMIISSERSQSPMHGIQNLPEDLQHYAQHVMSPAEYKTQLNHIKEHLASFFQNTQDFPKHREPTHLHLQHTPPIENEDLLFFRGIRMENVQWNALLSVIEQHTLEAITDSSDNAPVSPTRRKTL